MSKTVNELGRVAEAVAELAANVRERVACGVPVDRDDVYAVREVADRLHEVARGLSHERAVLRFSGPAVVDFPAPVLRLGGGPVEAPTVRLRPLRNL